METAKKEIELIPPKPELPPTFFDQLLLWTLRVAIPLVLLLQGFLILISSTRISLYTNLAQLSTAVGEKKKVVGQNQEFQDQILKTGRRVSTIVEIKKQALCTSCYMEEINQLARPDASVTSMALSQAQISISSESPNAISFAKFLERAVAEEEITGIFLTSSSREQDGTYTFALVLNFTPKFLL